MLDFRNQLWCLVNLLVNTFDRICCSLLLIQFEYNQSKQVKSMKYRIVIEITWKRAPCETFRVFSITTFRSEYSVAAEQSFH